MTATDPKTEWCRDYANVLLLAHHLTDTAEISTVSTLLDYFSAPWKWTPEWEEMQAQQKAATETPTPAGDPVPW